ncbi:MAG: pyrimidine utilization protein D [Pseudomonadota bacterium]
MPHIAGLHYGLHGPEGGEPLILSAGLGGSGNYWLPNLPALAERFRVILYDHRGTGRSDRALPDAVTVEQFADDMLLLMDGLGIGRAHVMGHAAGGIAALALALKAPARVNRIAVVNGWAKADPHFLRCFDARLALLRGAGPEAYLRAQPIFLFPANWISEHSAELDAELPHQLAQFPGRETMEKRIAALAAFDATGRLGEIAALVLVMASADDMLVPSNAARRLADGLPHARLVLCPTGGHAINVTCADSFNQTVLAWFAGDSPQ